jgi:hypothetical protein
MSGLINWDVLAGLIFPGPGPGPGIWDRFAVEYDGYARLETEFTRFQIEAMNLSADESLLDIGAGPGRITVPAAKIAGRVTALDASGPMLEVLGRNVCTAGLVNVSRVHMPWEQVVIGEHVQPHDVVIASRSPGMRDLRKLDSAAIKRAYVMLFSGPSLKEFHDELLDGVLDVPAQRRPMRGSLSGHALVFNQLCDMGIDPNVTFVPDGFTNWYETRDSAYRDLSWLHVPADRVERFRHNVDAYLQPENGGYRLLEQTKTAIVWWSK